MRTLIFLGTGTSVGVPMLGCECDVCRSTNPHNHRMRCSVVAQLGRGNLLIDTGPELRLQLLRERLWPIHAVVFTHYHADHFFGLDDIRPLCRFLDGPMPIHCDAEVEERIRASFSYALPNPDKQQPGIYLPRLEINRIDEQPFFALGEMITPIPLEHASSRVLGFRIGDLAYCTDVSRIPPRSWPLLEGLDTLILDALRHKPHIAHFSLGEALDIIAKLRPKRAFLTHMSHELDHDATNAQLPAHVRLAYDGLRLPF